MVDLKPLIVVTGTIRVAGGGVSTIRKRQTQADGVTITLDRHMTDDRREANVIATHFLRRLRKIALLRTPYGVLVAPDRLDDVKTLLGEISRMIADYNDTKRVCSLANCVLRERLRGERLHAVTGWIAVQLDRRNKAVETAISELLDRPADAAVASGS